MLHAALAGGKGWRTAMLVGKGVSAPPATDGGAPRGSRCRGGSCCRCPGAAVAAAPGLLPGFDQKLCRSQVRLQGRNQGLQEFGSAVYDPVNRTATQLLDRCGIHDCKNAFCGGELLTTRACCMPSCQAAEPGCMVVWLQPALAPDGPAMARGSCLHQGQHPTVAQ